MKESDANTNYFTRENSRKPNSRQHKITKYSLEPISRHRNILESSREKNPQFDKNTNLENLDKFLDNKSIYKEKLQNIALNSNFKIPKNGEKSIKRELSVNKLKKPLTNNSNNIIPFVKNDYTSEICYKTKLNDDHLIDDNIITKSKKLLLTKENFDNITQDLVNSKNKNIKIELSSKYPSNNNNFSGKVSKINYNGNYSKNLNNNLKINIDYQKIIEKGSNISSNLPKYIKSSTQKREFSSKEVNFNSHLIPKPCVNVIPSITSLNNSNDKTISQNNEHFTYNNFSKKLELDVALTKAIKNNDDNFHLKEMPIPSLNLYNGKGNYNRLNSGYRDLKYRNELSRKEEIYHSLNGMNN